MTPTETLLDHPTIELSCRAREHCFEYIQALLGESIPDRSELLNRITRFESVLLQVGEYQTPLAYHNLEAGNAEPAVEQLMSSCDVRCVWPNGKRFALCLTHDVDHLRITAHVERLRALRSVQNASLKDRLALCASVSRHTLRRILSGIQHYPLEIWLHAEDKYGFRSTFYFMGGPLAVPDVRDIYYRLDDSVLCDGQIRRLKEVLPTLVAGGWEVGMHGSIASAMDVEIARAERQRLCDAARTDVISGRQHYLNYDILRTSLVHEAAGLRTDSTLGSNVLPVNYRIGTGLPFPMFHLLEDRPLNLIQVPLIIHDNALMFAANNNVDGAVELATKCLRSAAQCGGMVTLLFHPNYVEDSREFLVYREILAIANDLQAWGCTVADAVQWFLERPHCIGKVAA